MRIGALVLATMLAIAPLGAKAADLVVWWEQGSNPEEDAAVKEIIAAFEQETGKKVELVLHRKRSSRPDLVAAIEAGRPPDFVFGVLIPTTTPAMGLRGSARRPLGHCRAISRPLRSGRARVVHAAQRDDRPASALCAADGARDQPRPRLEKPPGAGRVHPRGHPQGVGGVLGVLVRRGAAGRAPGYGPRRHLGHRPHHVGRRSTPRTSSSSSFTPMRPTT